MEHLENQGASEGRNLSRKNIRLTSANEHVVGLNGHEKGSNEHTIEDVAEEQEPSECNLPVKKKIKAISCSNGSAEGSNDHMEKLNGITVENVNKEKSNGHAKMSNGHTKDDNFMKLGENKTEGINEQIVGSNANIEILNGHEESSNGLMTENHWEEREMSEPYPLVKKKINSTGEQEDTNGSKECIMENTEETESSNDHDIIQKHSEKRKSPEADTPMKKIRKAESEHTQSRNESVKTANGHTNVPAQIPVKHVQKTNQAKQSFPLLSQLLTNCHTPQQPQLHEDAYVEEHDISNNLFDIQMRVNSMQWPPQYLTIDADPEQLHFINQARSQRRVDLSDLLPHGDGDDCDSTDSAQTERSNGQSGDNNSILGTFGIQLSTESEEQQKVSSYELFITKYVDILNLLVSEGYTERISYENEEKVRVMIDNAKEEDEDDYQKIITFIESLMVSTGWYDEELNQIETDSYCETMKPPPLTYVGPQNNFQRPWTTCPVDLNRPGPSREFAGSESYEAPPQPMRLPTFSIPEPVLRFDRHFKNVRQKLDHLKILNREHETYNDVFPFSQKLRTIITVEDLKLLKANIYQELRCLDPFYPSSDSSGDLSE